MAYKTSDIKNTVYTYNKRTKISLMLDIKFKMQADNSECKTVAGLIKVKKERRGPQKQGYCRMVWRWWWTRGRVCILWIMVYTWHGWCWRTLSFVKIKRHCKHIDMPLKMHNTKLLFMFQRLPFLLLKTERKNSDGERKRVKWCEKIGVRGLVRHVDCDSDPTLENLHHSIPSTRFFFLF